jgi:hypothetical protein
MLRTVAFNTKRLEKGQTYVPHFLKGKFPQFFLLSLVQKIKKTFRDN